MKGIFYLCPLFLIGCISFQRIEGIWDLDAAGFASNTVHVAEGHHIKLLQFAHEQFGERDLFHLAEQDYSKGIHSFVGHGVDLGMNDIPVLDQGQYGTCVTFSSTAALDALIRNGDFISQQCSLELDSALGENFWNGAYYPSQIVDPLVKYGVVEKSKCKDQYPAQTASITLQDYQGLIDKVVSKKIALVKYQYSSAHSLDDVKKALDKGHRVLTGFSIQNNSKAVRGFDVKVDGQQFQGGLWACKQGLGPNYCSYSQAGHEVVIIGYDNDQELLKIRNSWSSVVGDHGDYYMSYAFFNAMSRDQTEIW